MIISQTICINTTIKIKTDISELYIVFRWICLHFELDPDNFLSNKMIEYRILTVG